MSEPCDEVVFERSAALHIVVTPERVRITVEPVDPQRDEDEGVSGLRTRPSDGKSPSGG